MSILGIAAAAWFGNLEYRIRKLDDRQRKIDVQLEGLRVLQLEIKEDIKELKENLRSERTRFEELSLSRSASN